MKKRFQLRISGRVQGVWYRASALKQAEALGLSGFVRNEPDGSVYAEIEGPEDALDQMIDWCKEGPQFARVTKVDTQEVKLLNEDGFSIQRN